MEEASRFWNEPVETMSLDKLRKLQDEKLQELVNRAYENTALYRRKFDQAGVKPADIRTLDDLPKLPFTTYLEDFCQTPIPEKLAVPLEKIKIVSSTSGTVSGFTQPFLMTEQDWERMTDMEARCRWSMGIRPADVVQVLTGFDCCARGYEVLGATVLLGHCGRRNLDYQIGLTRVMDVTVLEHLPSLVLRYFERAKQLGIEVRQTRLRLVSGVGEGWAETFKKQVETEYGVPFRTLYGSVESGAGTAECEAGGGMHILGDCGIIEVIDPETQEMLEPGMEGEVVMTTFLNEAMPSIRYRMGDVAKLLPYEPCSCGRTHPKLSMVRGRTSQIIRVQGKKILPIDVEEVVAGIKELGDEYQITRDKPGDIQRLKVKVEHRPGVEDSAILRNRVEEALHNQLGIDSEVELVPMGALGQALFKAQRLVTTYG